MKIIALAHEKSSIPEDQFMPMLKKESQHVWDLMKTGVIREIHFRENSYSAVLTLECASAAEAKGILDSFPLVAAGAITFEIIPLVPWEGLEILFA